MLKMKMQEYQNSAIDEIFMISKQGNIFRACHQLETLKQRIKFGYRNTNQAKKEKLQAKLKKKIIKQGQCIYMAGRWQ